MNTHDYCHVLARGDDYEWSAWLDSIRDIAPEHFGPCPECDRPDSPDALAIAMAIGLETTGAEGVANYRAMWQTAESHLNNAETHSRAHGDVNAYRAAVDTLQRDTDADPTRVGRKVDPIEGTRHTVRKRRNRKGGDGSIVTHRGMAPVQGDRQAPDPDDVLAAMASHLLAMARPMVLGVASLDVTRITNAVYRHHLDVVPVSCDDRGNVRHESLIGTDWEVWTDSPNALAFPEPIAAPTADAVPTIIAREGTERDETGRITYMAHRHCNHNDQTRRANTDRKRLPQVRIRKAEMALSAPRTIQYAPLLEADNGRTINRARRESESTWSVVAQIASADRSDAAWFGHRLIERKARQPRKVRQVRRARVAAAPELETLSELGASELLESLARGESITVRVNARVLTASRTGSGKYNARVKLQGEPTVTLQGRTVPRIAARIAALVA